MLLDSLSLALPTSRPAQFVLLQRKGPLVKKNTDLELEKAPFGK